MNWIDYICELTKSAETPKKFRKWACIAAISAVAKRKIFLPKGDGEYILYTCYPNLSILIVDQSGNQRKSYAVSLCEKIMKHVPSVLNIAGHNTIQSIVKDMSSVRTSKDGKHQEKSDGSVFLSSDEWTNLVVEDPDALTQLNALLDSHYHDEWSSRTKTAGSDKFPNPYCTMFGATTSEHLETRIQKKDLLGGFFARTLVVSGSSPVILNSLTKTKGIVLPYEQMAQHLNKIATINGQFEWSPAAEDIFDSWYRNYMSMGKDKLDEIDKTNLIYKAQDHVCRVAMCLELAEENPVLVITEDKINEAIDLVQDCLQDSRKSLFTVGTPKNSDVTNEGVKAIFSYLIESYLKGEKSVKRTKVLQKFYGLYGAAVLDKIEFDLVQSNYIRAETWGKDKVYIANPEQIKQYEELAERLKSRKRV